MSLAYLMDEICSGIEIYYTGRTGGQYLKTAFILCDDYTELTSKLFLLNDDPNWSDTKANGRFKNYHNVMQEVEAIFATKRNADLATVQTITAAMETRRNRRNDFFHSTNLLDLNITQRICVEAFCDLLDYGELLFPSQWRGIVDGTRNMDILEVLLRLEKKSFSDPTVHHKLTQILSEEPCVNWRWDRPKAPNGVYLVAHPEDMHLRMCAMYGGTEFKEKLERLL